MRVAHLHSWPRSATAAIALQRKLAGALVEQAIVADLRLIGGIDVAFSRDATQVIAGIVIWDCAAGQVVEQQVARAPCTFPYVPGLLSFREIPAVLRAARRLRTRPAVFLCDGQGYAHPRRMGLACHIGLWLDVPTVGCAKSRLCGEHAEPGPNRGDTAPLTLAGEVVGCVLRTRRGVKPLYVSRGHLCDDESARRVTLLATTRYRLPEPARLAHRLVTQARLGSAPRG